MGTVSWIFSLGIAWWYGWHYGVKSEARRQDRASREMAARRDGVAHEPPRRDRWHW